MLLIITLNKIKIFYRCIQSQHNISQNDPILDVGCGNALLLTQLVIIFIFYFLYLYFKLILLQNNNSYQAKLGFSNLSGIDYSAPAVKLANSIIEEQKIENITLKEFDFLTDDVKTLSTFSLVLDKGTYDVISMNDESKEKRNRYKENIINLLQPKGMFLIVSCNWTQLELNEQFEDGKKLIKPLISHQY